MKAFGDFLAIVLFLITYFITKNIVWATGVAVLVGVIQAGLSFYQHKKLQTMQWLSLFLIVIMGGLTIVFKDGRFIMLKTTALTWLMALAMWGAQLKGKNGIKMLLSKEFSLPDGIWKRLVYAWIVFLLFMGLLNLIVAYPFTPEREEIWVQFKLYAYLPLSLLFAIGQGIYLVKHLPKGNQ